MRFYEADVDVWVTVLTNHNDKALGEHKPPPRLKKILHQEEKQVVKVIWQKAPHGGPIPRLGVTPGGRKLYHWIPGVGFPISVQ